MITTVITIALIVLLATLLLSVWRMIKGPTTMDRILSFDAFAICIIAIIVLLFMKWKSEFYIDLVLVFSVLGFFGTVTYAYYLHKTYPVHHNEKPGEKATEN